MLLKVAHALAHAIAVSLSERGGDCEKQLRHTVAGDVAAQVEEVQRFMTGAVGATAGGSATTRRMAAYLQHVLASGQYPRLAELLAPPGAAPQEPPPDPADRYPEIMRRVLAGLLEA